MIPLWIRIVHWVIAVLFLLLIITGITQHFSTVKFSIIDYSIATTIHELSGIILTIVYIWFLIGIFRTRYWRKYLPRGRKLWRLVWGQSQFKGTNPATIFVLLPLLIATGLYYYFPGYAPDKIFGFDGLWTIAMGHYIVGALGVAYTIGHVFMAFFNSTLRKMIYGRARSSRLGKLIDI